MSDPPTPDELAALKAANPTAGRPTDSGHLLGQAGTLLHAIDESQA